MPDVRKVWRSSRKHLLNLLFFLISIVIVVAIWPPDKCETWTELLGTMLIVSSCYLILYLFLSHFRPEILKVTRKTLFIIIIILFFVALTRFVVLFSDERLLYLIPFAIIPIIICTFYDARLALFILLITLMLSGFIVPDPFGFVFISFISGVVAIFSLTNIYRRARLFFSSVVVVLSYSVIHFAFTLMEGESLFALNLIDYGLFIGNGFLILLSYPVIFIFEKKFFFLSDTTLLELSDINHPLLRRFADEAPGSFQHSLQVANLAGEAARAVGANLLLARAGALYHDVGKITNAEYFIENQSSDVNPHTALDPAGSSKLIINHVNEGVILARRYKLPVQIIDFIRTHHGTSRAYFFYLKYLGNSESSSEVDKVFSYPGPKPFSRETAIVMMADAVEASSRTLEKYNGISVSELVEKIILLQENDSQFSEAPLTFKDLSEIKAVFKKQLLNIHHMRAIYPEREYPES
jgi:cyclic-di-AMP phosphodiesterase PgpH